jgi:hypothetical protein
VFDVLLGERGDEAVVEAEGERSGLTLVGDFASRWRLEADNLLTLRDALGAELLSSFCRCFVYSDRLTSLAQMLLWNSAHEPRAPVAYGRNVLTILWLFAGTLREMALATQHLRSALAKRGWLVPDSKPIQRLRDFESRWEQDPLYRALRNTGAFHVDLDVIAKGLDALSARSGPVLLAEGSGPLDHDMRLAIGAEVLILGVDDDTEAVRAAFRSVHPDHKTHLALQELFVEALDKAGVRLAQSDWPAVEVM